MKTKVTSGGTSYYYVPSTYGALKVDYEHTVTLKKFNSDRTVTPINYSYRVIQSDGASHALGWISATGTDMQALDGSGFRYTGATPIGTSTVNYGGGVVVDKNGIQYCVDRSCIMRDTKGNTVTYSTTTPGILDSIGRIIPGFSTPPNPAVGCTTYNMPAVNGGTAPFILCFASYTATSNFPTSPYFSNGSYPINMLQSITLPNGTSWTFNYTSWGTYRVSLCRLAARSRTVGIRRPLAAQGSYLREQSPAGLLTPMMAQAPKRGLTVPIF